MNMRWRMVFAAGVAAAVLVGGSLESSATGMKGSLKDDPYVEACQGAVEVNSGGEVLSNDSWLTYLGVTVALNKCISKRGFLISTSMTHGEYEYKELLGFVKWDPAAIDIEGDFFAGDILFGYQWIHNHFWGRIFIGFDHQNHSLTPVDPNNTVVGSESGFKVAAEIESDDRSRLYFRAEGSFSTAFDVYYFLGRLGLRMGHVVIGPEIWFWGDDAVDTVRRWGGFIQFPLRIFGQKQSEISISVGRQEGPSQPNTPLVLEDLIFNGEDGTYGTLNWIKTF